MRVLLPSGTAAFATTRVMGSSRVPRPAVRTSAERSCTVSRPGSLLVRAALPHHVADWTIARGTPASPQRRVRVQTVIGRRPSEKRRDARNFVGCRLDFDVDTGGGIVNGHERRTERVLLAILLRPKMLPVADRAQNGVQAGDIANRCFDFLARFDRSGLDRALPCET